LYLNQKEFVNMSARFWKVERMRLNKEKENMQLSNANASQPMKKLI